MGINWLPKLEVQPQLCSRAQGTYKTCLLFFSSVSPPLAPFCPCNFILYSSGKKLDFWEENSQN